jgi:hypothetical protein
MGGTEGILALAELLRVGAILACLAGVWYIFVRFIIHWRVSVKRFFICSFCYPLMTGGAAFLILRDWRWGLVFASPIVFPCILLFFLGLFLLAVWLIPDRRLR